MKNLLKASMLVLLVLTVLAGCELFNGINVAWSVDSMTYANPYEIITYTVQNLGKVDLNGVNLQVGVDVLGNGFYPNREWTLDFDLARNQVKSGSVNVFVGPVPAAGGAMVTSIDMDDPQS